MPRMVSANLKKNRQNHGVADRLNAASPPPACIRSGHQCSPIACVDIFSPAKHFETTRFSFWRSPLSTGGGFSTILVGGGGEFSCGIGLACRSCLRVIRPGQQPFRGEWRRSSARQRQRVLPQPKPRVGQDYGLGAHIGEDDHAASPIRPTNERVPIARPPL